MAQDRGRLEARIEVLTAEMETQRKQNDRDHDALRIKAKIVDDQTETIRKLKEVLSYLLKSLLFQQIFHIPIIYLISLRSVRKITLYLMRNSL